jgi:hypothetical protein
VDRASETAKAFKDESRTSEEEVGASKEAEMGGGEGKGGQRGRKRREILII